MEEEKAVNCPVCHQAAAKKTTAEKRAWVVVMVTLVTMVAEIVFGIVSGSMALLADGIHMGTHALALGITAISYYLARRYAGHSGFSFGTGKIGILAGYTNALLLGGAALVMIYEAVERLLNPQSIEFSLAILVTVSGLAVNMACALILGHEGHEHHNHHAPHNHHEHSGHDEDHETQATPGHYDTNMRGALLHVVADAMTSVMALLALFVGRQTGFIMLDPLMGIVGALLILHWARGLLKETAALLVDYGNYGEELAAIKNYFAQRGEPLADLHIWRFGDNAYSLLVTVHTARPRDEIATDLKKIHDFDHLVVEVR